MDERTTGLILRTRPLTETSLIVHWLTRDFGRLSTVAKGGRRPKSPFSGKLDLFYLADFSFHASQRSELHTLREVNLRDDYRKLRLNLAALQQACYFVQALEQSTEINTPLPGMFELFQQVIDLLAATPPRALTVLAFETKLLTALGLSPELTRAGSSASLRDLLRRLEAVEWPNLAGLSVDAKQVQELDLFLQSCLIEHFGRLAKARPLAVHVEHFAPAHGGVRI